MQVRVEELRAPSSIGSPALSHQLIRHEETSARPLVIMLPGRNYSCETGVLFYLSRLILENGCDMLKINYGVHQQAQPDTERLQAELHATIALVAGHYPQLSFIGKSMGSTLAVDLAQRHNTQAGSLILLTPTEEALAMLQATPRELLAPERRLIIAGTADPLYQTAAYRAAKEAFSPQWVDLDGLTHSLSDPANWRRSLSGLTQLLAACEPLLWQGQAPPKAQVGDPFL